MNDKESMADDEIGLADLREKLREGWRHLLGGALLGVAAAGVALSVLPQKFEAVAVVQIAQIGQIGPSMQVSSQSVEPATQVVERMKTPSFQMSVARAVGNETWLVDLQHSANAAAKYISVQAVKSSSVQGVSSLVELKATDTSPESALRIAEGSVRELAARQAELARPLLEKMRVDLAIAREKLAGAERELDGIGKVVAAAGIRDDRFTQLSLMTALRVQKESEIYAQRNAIIALETALSVPATQQTRAIEEVFAADRPVSPNRYLLLALGLVGGLLAGVLWLFFFNASRRGRRTRAVRPGAGDSGR